MSRKSCFLATPLLAVLACFLWSTAFVGVKIGLRYSPPFSFAGIRFMISGLLLVPFWWHKYPHPFRTFSRNFRRIMVISFFQTTLLYGLFYEGLTMVPGALAAIINGTGPLTAALAAHFFMPDEEMTQGKFFSLLIGLGGVLLISISRQPWASAVGMVEFTGILILLASSFSSVMGNIIVAKEKHQLDPIFLTSVQIFMGGLTLLLFSIPMEGMPRLIREPEYYGALAWLSLLSAVAFSLWFTLLKRPGVKVSELNLWKFIIPVCGALLSWSILPDEHPQLSAVCGMACIAVAIILYNRSTMRARKAAQKIPVMAQS